MFFQWTTIFILVNTVEWMHCTLTMFILIKIAIILYSLMITLRMRYAATNFNVNIIVMNFSVANCLSIILSFYECVFEWTDWNEKEKLFQSQKHRTIYHEKPFTVVNYCQIQRYKQIYTSIRWMMSVIRIFYFF